MKENKKQSNFNRTLDNRNADISIIGHFFLRSQAEASLWEGQ